MWGSLTLELLGHLSRGDLLQSEDEDLGANVPVVAGDDEDEGGPLFSTVVVAD